MGGVDGLDGIPFNGYVAITYGDVIAIRVGELRQTKVRDFDAVADTVAIDQNVPSGQVPMDQAHSVQIVHALWEWMEALNRSSWETLTEK